MNYNDENNNNNVFQYKFYQMNTISRTKRSY